MMTSFTEEMTSNGLRLEASSAETQEVREDDLSFSVAFKGMFIELDYGKIYRKALYLMVKTMVSCRFSLNPIQ